MYSHDELFMRSVECCFGAYFPRCCATRKINTKITLPWAHKQFVTRVHTSINMYTRMVLNSTHQFVSVKMLLMFIMTMYLEMTDTLPSDHWVICYCPACRTTLIATRFRVAVICPIIQVPHCIRVFFYFVWFVFINHIFQFYYELCTYCNILDIYLS